MTTWGLSKNGCYKNPIQIFFLFDSLIEIFVKVGTKKASAETPSAINNHRVQRTYKILIPISQASELTRFSEQAKTFTYWTKPSTSHESVFSTKVHQKIGLFFPVKIISRIYSNQKSKKLN